MAQIYKPQKKSDGLGEILTIGGGIVGGIYGGPGGAMAGAQLGGMAGNMMADNSESPNVGEAASRRLGGDAQPMQQVDDPMTTVEKARIAVANLPPDQQAIFAPALQTGMAALRRQQQTQQPSPIIQPQQGTV
jgi:hypothetical protein